VLAVATRVAHRERLPAPVPASIRVASARAADESAWQELVVSGLGLSDWLRLDFDDELDLVGPVARQVMRRHGLLWPFNAHFHVPMLEAAGAGAVLTGIGGDELFGSVAVQRPTAVLTGRERPVPRDARRIALHLAPATVRRAWHGRPSARLDPWLTPAAQRAGRRALAAWEAAEPRRVAARMRHVRAARYLDVGVASLDRLARDSGALIAHPLLEPAVWAAAASSAPRGGHRDRSAAMAAVLGGLLPPELLARGDKACFDEVFFNDHSRTFAAAWTGTGVPAGLVDPDALRSHWLAGEPSAQSFTLLQAAWLASADGVEEPVGGAVERVPAPGTA
jgi:asparagine synthase (glutamine-hydrolysing)